MKQWKSYFAILIIPILFLIIGIHTLGDYGINWDEPYHYRRGQAFLQFFLTGQKTYFNLPKYPALKGDSDNPDFRNAQKLFEDAEKNQTPANSNFRRSFYQDDAWNGEYFIDLENSFGHPALNDVSAALFNKIFYQKLGILGDLESYRLFIVLVVSLAVFAIAIFIWKEFGTIESIIASLAFASYPLILGEQHFNIKDPVETAFYTLTIITAYIGISKNKLNWLFVSGLFFGLALSTKFNIVFSIIPLSLWFLYFIYTKRKKIKTGKLFKKIIIASVLSITVSLGLLLSSYPALWKNPIDGIRKVIGFYLEVGYPKTPIPGYHFLGFINTFPTTWILYTTPPILLVLFISSLVLAKQLIKKNTFIFLLLAWILVTIGRNSLFGALSYGGVRLIMEYIPALAMVVGITAGFLIKKINNKAFSILIFSLILLSFIPTINKLMQIHPNENVYFNFLIGGLSGAKEKGIPYWGDSYGNAYYPGVSWLNKNAEKDAKVTTPVGNTSNIPRFKLRPDIAVSPNYWSGLKHLGEYVIELTYDYPPENWFSLGYLNAAMVPVYETKVDGVPIAKVWKNDDAHIKPEYKNTKDISASITTSLTKQSISLEIPQPKKIMKIKISEPIKNCSAIQTGYVELSNDGVVWLREPEDIARDQLNRQILKELTPAYEFYFIGKEAKIIRFNVGSKNSCLLKAKSASITILNN